uniref:Uncharacterized protein n=1 Tax=Kalanchoe fedtschenkoi TaxID=63787 RepID=A0A7N0SYQ3_KALFE
MLKCSKFSFLWRRVCVVNWGSCVRNGISRPLDMRLLLQRRLILNRMVSSCGHPKISSGRRDRTLDDNVAEGNWLLSKLSREKRIGEARQVFDRMAVRDVVTWSIVISGYVKCGMIEEARRLFDRADAVKNVVTWTALLNGYVRLNELGEAERLFGEMPEKNVISWNTMIDGYARNGRVDEALSLFEQMPERNVVSWNTIITALSQCGRVDEARMFFDRMPCRDVISWTTMISGLSRNGRIDEAREVFDTMPSRNIVSWNAIVTGYAQNLRLDEAIELFEKMPEKDLRSWNTMITGFIQNGNVGAARNLFNRMTMRNVVSWTTMITGYVLDKQSEEALLLFTEMLTDGGATPNEATFLSVLSACSDLAGLSEGQQVHQLIIKTIYQNTRLVVSALINMYSKCGELSIARKMFYDGSSSHRDLISWNGMVAAYAHHGYGTEAIKLFNEMRDVGVKPNDVTYVALLAACSHSGLVEDGLKFFEELVRDKSIKLRDDHFTCLVDLCGRSGRLKSAYEFIYQLDIKSSSLWGALLAGCNVHGDADIGKLAAEKILDVEPDNVGTYLTLANTYASSGKWQEASELRSKMKDTGLKKQPGCSWIEIENRFHVFIVGEKSHSQFNLINRVLRNLHLKMKKDVIVPDELFASQETLLT